MTWPAQLPQPTPAEGRLTAVLLALWQSPRTTLADLARAADLPPEIIRQALLALARRGCLIESTPQQIELVRTGLSCWRDILEATTSHPLGRHTLVFRTTASTNDICAHAAGTASEPLVVLADQQTAGRGRRGAPWHAKPGQSILLSILLPNYQASVESVTLLLGLAVAEALEPFVQYPVAIKWPNDVLFDDRKIAGVLVETRGADIILGVGINVAQSAVDFPPDLRPRASSLYLATGRHVDRLRVVVPLLARLGHYVLPPAPPEAWLPAWKSRCHLLGQTVTARSGDQTFTGQVLDIDPLHGLVLRDALGATHFLSAPTTTLAPAAPGLPDAS